MNFMIFDLIFLGLFVIFIGLFLYNKRKTVEKEGLLYLYHTKWGLELISKTGKKYKKILKILSYVSVILGYFLMVAMLYFFGKIIFIYLFQSDLVKAIKLPPIMPLIPYLPRIFKLSFLPPFYFSYWIIILAIIAVTHEFFHGIFAKMIGVKTKTTGFGFFPFFFPVFLAAFVNLDEKQMKKKTSFEQRAVLSAGTFANILTAILGLILMWGLFSTAFVPTGVVYDGYAYGIVNLSDITSINGNQVNWSSYNFETLKNISNEKIKTATQEYFAFKAFDPESGLAALYYSAPAINQNLTGAITKINGEQITSLEKLSSEIKKYSIGDKVSLEMYDGNEYFDKALILGKNPETNEPWIGITFSLPNPPGLISKASMWATSFKRSNIYYVPSFEFAQYLYDFLWWLVLISFSVALVNMLPMGIFDGGRFFYLTVLSLTKSEKLAKKAFKTMTFFLLFLVLVLMISWIKNLF